MTTRTSRKTVTFVKPFVLPGNDEIFPHGDYDVETDEELIDGLSFIAYRRVASFMQLHPEVGGARTMTINPRELDAALARDRINVNAEEETGPVC